MDTHTDHIERYLAIWNETDIDRRRDLIARTWSDDARYFDPLLEASAAAGIDAMVAGFQQQLPGLTFVSTGETEFHHDRLRFTWDLLAPGGERIAAGTDVAVLAADGRFREVIGFFDMAPVLPADVMEGTIA